MRPILSVLLSGGVLGFLPTSFSSAASCRTSSAELHGGDSVRGAAGDWVRFNACAGRSCSLRASGSELFGPDCSTRLATGSETEWTAPADGLYHIRLGAGRTVALVGDTGPCSTWAFDVSAPEGSGEFRPFDVQQTPDGGFVIGGDTNSFGIDGLDFDFYLLRLSATGQVLWQKTYGTTDFEGFTGLAQTADGGFVLAGRADTDGKTDGWLMRTDAAGQRVWQRRYDSHRDDELSDVVATSDGGFLAVGSTRQSNGTETWVLRTDASGGTLWSYRYGSDNEYGRAVDLTPSGGAVVGANTASSPATSYDFWVFELDPSGQILWQRAYGGPGTEQLWDLRRTVDGGLIAIGQTDGFIPEPGVLAKVWVLRLDSVGNVLWQKELAWGSFNIGWKVEPLPDGSALLAAATQTHSGWLIRIDAAGSVLSENFYTGAGSLHSVTRSVDGSYVVAGSGAAGVMRVVRTDSSGSCPGCSLVNAGRSSSWTTAATTRTTNFGRQQFAPVETVITIAAVDPAAAYQPGCPCPTPAYVGTLSLGGNNSISWTPGAPAFDLVRGDLDILRSSGGSFYAALPPTSYPWCILNNTPLLSDTDFAVPAPGAGFFYVQRGVDPSCPGGLGGHGTFDGGGPSQIAPRDYEIEAAIPCFY